MVAGRAHIHGGSAGHRGGNFEFALTAQLDVYITVGHVRDKRGKNLEANGVCDHLRFGRPESDLHWPGAVDENLSGDLSATINDHILGADLRRIDGYVRALSGQACARRR